MLRVTAAVGCVALAAAEGNVTRRYPRGYRRAPRLDGPAPVVELTAADLAATPSSLDWSAKGATTPIKDQKECGSCYAFSTVETIESAVFMSSGALPPPLSIQQLVACGPGGCEQGGDPIPCVNYFKKAGGVDTEADYPDTSSKSGKTGKCKWDKKSVVTVSGYKMAVPECDKSKCSTDADKLSAALAKYGPLAICVNSETWDNYKSGILKGKCSTSGRDTDHCVQLVGYDRTASTPYWKVRNSWGKSWGENGFLRIAIGNNDCCVGCEAVVINAESKNPAPPKPPAPPAPVPPPTPAELYACKSGVCVASASGIPKSECKQGCVAPPGPGPAPPTPPSPPSPPAPPAPSPLSPTCANDKHTPTGMKCIDQVLKHCPKSKYPTLQDCEDCTDKQGSCQTQKIANACCGDRP